MINFNKFTGTDPSDMDTRSAERVIKNVVGRLTKRRCQRIDEICKENTFFTPCGHEWDCCGCLCSQRMSWKFDKGNIIISVTQHFNY